MTGVELVVTALTAGAAVGLKDTASSAVRDGYQRLREAVSRRLAAHGDESEQGLEDGKVDPDLLLARLSEADVDSAILDAAVALLQALEADGLRAGTNVVDARQAKGVQVGGHNMQTNTFS